MATREPGPESVTPFVCQEDLFSVSMRILCGAETSPNQAGLAGVVFKSLPRCVEKSSNGVK